MEAHAAEAEVSLSEARRSALPGSQQSTEMQEKDVHNVELHKIYRGISQDRIIWHLRAHKVLHVVSHGLKALVRKN